MVKIKVKHKFRKKNDRNGYFRKHTYPCRKWLRLGYQKNFQILFTDMPLSKGKTSASKYKILAS